jgi:hypothetical protein
MYQRQFAFIMVLFLIWSITTICWMECQNRQEANRPDLAERAVVALEHLAAGSDEFLRKEYGK